MENKCVSVGGARFGASPCLTGPYPAAGEQDGVGILVSPLGMESGRGVDWGGKQGTWEHSLGSVGTLRGGRGCRPRCSCHQPARLTFSLSRSESSSPPHPSCDMVFEVSSGLCRCLPPAPPPHFQRPDQTLVNNEMHISLHCPLLPCPPDTWDVTASQFSDADFKHSLDLEI